MLLTAFTAAAQTQWNDYSVKDRTVFYQGQPLPDADAGSFAELGFGYARDRFNVYRHGEILEFVDPATFRVDARFTRRHKLAGDASAPKTKTAPEPVAPDATANYTPKTSNPLDILGSLGGDESGEYKVSGSQVTYEGQPVKCADAATFEILKAGYARDRHHAYYRGRRIRNALGGKHFTYQGDDYASDGLHTYFKGKEVNRD